METRSQARAKEGQSSSSPASLLEGSEPRPSSRASESEGDLGLSTLLGDGEASIVGRGRAMESAISGNCIFPVSSHTPVTVMDSAPTQIPLHYQGNVLRSLHLGWSLWQHSRRTRSDQCRSLHICS